MTAQRPFQAARRGLARTFQIVQPFPSMTVLENVAAGALFGGEQSSVAAADGRCARAARIHRASPQFADRPAAALTLAGRKRLELAKSMAMQPKVLMLDEVNAGLNASEIDGALRLIRQIAERGVTILVIEHLMKVVFSLASARARASPRPAHRGRQRQPRSSSAPAGDRGLSGREIRAPLRSGGAPMAEPLLTIEG